MKKSNLSILFCLSLMVHIGCQRASVSTLPSVSFDEAPAPQAISPVQDWDALEGGMHATWGSSNERYHKEYIPGLEISDKHSLSAWRNERLNAQMVVWSKDSLQDLTVEISELKSDGGTIGADPTAPPPYTPSSLNPR